MLKFGSLEGKKHKSCEIGCAGGIRVCCLIKDREHTRLKKETSFISSEVHKRLHLDLKKKLEVSEPGGEKKKKGF